MLYRAIEIDKLIDNKDSKHQIVDLMENNNSHLKLIYLKKNEEIEPHISNTDACIYITDGELEIEFSPDSQCNCKDCGCALPDEDNKNGKKYKIKKEQLFFFEKDILHSVKALKDTTFLLIKI